MQNYSAIIIFLVNVKFGTYLTGWDTLQSELNPWLSVKRAFFSVWQENQSFGLTAGMAHASDLIRALFIFFLSFFLPQNLVRYFYHSLMLFVGGLGMMTLLKDSRWISSESYQDRIDIENQTNKQEIVSFRPSDRMECNASLDFSVASLPRNDILSFLGALFYILNLGTVQIFYLPFEPFSTFFAFLPWGVWSFLCITYNLERVTYKKKPFIVFFNQSPWHACLLYPATFCCLYFSFRPYCHWIFFM